jgi:hypothetical protein
MDNQDIFAAGMLDFGYERAGSYNTADELTSLLSRLDDNPDLAAPLNPIGFSDVDKLCHIEDYNPDRVKWLADKITKEGVWTMPLCVDSSIGAVMDGQHRLEAAKLLKLSKVPAIVFNYDEVDVWTLRPGAVEVSVNDILARAQSGNIYPYKTAKHEFPYKIPRCNIELSTLKR